MRAVIVILLVVSVFGLLFCIGYLVVGWEASSKMQRATMIINTLTFGMLIFGNVLAYLTQRNRDEYR